MTRYQKYKTLSWLSVIIGSVSLMLFFHFVLFGPMEPIKLNLSDPKVIIFNFLLSALYFTQHSVMIRKKIRGIIEKYLPNESFYSFHSIFSGVLLGATVLLWQQTDFVIFSAKESFRYLFSFITIISIIGLLWSIISLTDFDHFGRKQISNYLANRKPQKQVFVLRGPYKITRHPFYFFILVMIWCYPVMTTDRLLFVIFWTSWVILGIRLEEKDLVKEIGNDYREYQKNVPMLIPYRVFLHPFSSSEETGA